MPLAATVAAYFAVAALLWALQGRRRGLLVAVAAAPFLAQLIVVATGIGEPTRIAWVPALRVALDFGTEPIHLLLTTVVAAIGLMIVVYSGGYMRDETRLARFLALMVLFSGGMAGIVTSDDLFGLFLFWEVTTVASYLLIGFDDEKGSARAAALQAVLVTTTGGLAMLGGFVLLAAQAGTSAISEIVAAPPSGTPVTAALALILVGAFAKSAQVPFHFWLPSAMAAPTPASAFLHSATMVKAGVVLLLFLAPGFQEATVWTIGVTGIGAVTMLTGAVQAMRQYDMKLLLAHGTVSQLGLMVTLIGIGFPGMALAVLVAHSAFKAALFLVVGAVDTLAGTRDLRELGGLGRKVPILAIAAGAAGLSMAGVPPLFGFVAKEAALDALLTAGEWTTVAAIAVASTLTVAYTLRLLWTAFGPGDGPVVRSEQSAPRSLLWPPMALVAASLVLGISPAGIGDVVTDATGISTSLVLWPGWKLALGLSAVIVAAGIAVHAIARPIGDERRRRRALPAASDLYHAGIATLNRVADGVTGIAQSGSLPTYLAVILTTVILIPTAAWLGAPTPLRSIRAANGLGEIVLALVAVAAAVAATRAQRRMAAAILLGVVGYAVAGIYVAFGAPDLALTQVLIETFTIALFAFVLSKLPRRFGVGPRSLARRTRIGVAVLSGAFVTTAALVVAGSTPDRSVAAFYAAEAEAAGGRNVVNVILTDFRALDTLGEISVLLVGGIGIVALAGRAVRRRAAAAGES